MMKRVVILLLGAACLGVCCFVAGRCYGIRSAVEVRETVRIDTCFYEKPAPHRVVQRPIAVRIPRVIFAPANAAEKAMAGDSSEITNTSSDLLDISSSDADSVAIELAIETRTYEDSLYRAQVSGPAVGACHPTLDWIELYNRTHTIIRTGMRRRRFAVTTGVGAAYTPEGIQPTIGVQVGVVLWGF